MGSFGGVREGGQREEIKGIISKAISNSSPSLGADSARPGLSVPQHQPSAASTVRGGFPFFFFSLPDNQWNELFNPVFLPQMSCFSGLAVARWGGRDAARPALPASRA